MKKKHVLVGVLVLAMAGGAWLGVWGYRVMRPGSPNIAVDYNAELNKPALAVPEGERAWPIYREAAVALGLADEAYDDVWMGTWPEDFGWKLTASHVRARADAIALLHEAPSKSGLGRVIHGTVIAQEDAVLYPDLPVLDETAAAGEPPNVYEAFATHLATLRQLGRALVVDAQLAMERGDSDRVEADLHTLLAMRRHASERPDLISALVGDSIQSLATQLISRLLQERPDLLDADAMLRLADALESHDFEAVGLRAFEGERLMFLDMVQRQYTDDGHGDGHFVGSDMGAPQEAVSVFGRFAVASRAELVKKYDEMHAMDMALFTSPPWERVEPTSQSLMDGWGERERMKYLTISFVYTAVLHASNSRRITQAHGEVTALALRIHAARQQGGAWPNENELADLMARHPVLDPFTGEPVKVVIADGQLTIYCVGPDGDDDAGQHPETWTSSSNDPARYHRPGTDETLGIETVDGDWVVFPWYQEPFDAMWGNAWQE